MPVDRREAIATVARRYDLNIIEDEAYAFLESIVQPSIQFFAPERTLQVFSLSKMVSNLLRLGAVILPKTCAGRAADYLRFAGASAHPVAAAAAARMARDGWLATLAESKRLEGAARFDIARFVDSRRRCDAKRVSHAQVLS
jgi:DNA-binding transcriptional MocR family regulator